jgi:DNA replication licensing factor MCM7
LEGLNLNGEEEEYDMVDDADDPAPNGARTRNGPSKIKYMNQLQEVANRERDEIVIDLNDVEQYERATTDDEHNYKLIESIERNAHHYIDIISRAVDKCLPPPTKDLKYATPEAREPCTVLTRTASRMMSWT